MFRVFYGQHRAGRHLHDLLRHAADQCVGNAGPAVRGEDDEVNVVVLGIANDGNIRNTGFNCAADFDPLDFAAGGLQPGPQAGSTGRSVASCRP